MTETSAAEAATCTDAAFCQHAGGCEDCNPDQWRSIRPRIAGRRGVWHGQSYENARAGLRDLREHLHDLGDQLVDAHTDGFRLYDVADDGTIYLCKGRVKR